MGFLAWLGYSSSVESSRELEVAEDEILIVVLGGTAMRIQVLPLAPCEPPDSVRSGRQLGPRFTTALPNGFYRQGKDGTVTKCEGTKDPDPGSPEGKQWISELIRKVVAADN